MAWRCGAAAVAVRSRPARVCAASRRRTPRRNPKALSAAQFATLEALADAIIPTDDRSSRREAGARRRLHRSAAQSNAPPELTLQWLGGLAALDVERDATIQCTIQSG